MTTKLPMTINPAVKVEPTTTYRVEFFRIKTADDRYWLEVTVDGQHYAEVGPFDTEDERDAAHDDMFAMLSGGCGSRSGTLQ